MTGSHESASNERPPAAPGRQRVLICGVNWIGDAVMSMPAICAFSESHPAAEISMMVKPGVSDLWRLQGVPSERILVLEKGFTGTMHMVKTLKKAGFDMAYVMPHSFRSAVIPWLAGIPARIGMPGHMRDFMLSRVVEPRVGNGRTHQAYEYYDLLVPEHGDRPIKDPSLTVPERLAAEMEKILAGLPRPWVGFLPGAARGASKRWPVDSFVDLGHRLLDGAGAGIVVMGSAAEQAECERITRSLGENSLNLAGKTDVGRWLAALKKCDLVIANDSGGMHLAAAVGTPLVALFGITDPQKTGPLGGPRRILQKSDRRSRDVARESEEARAALADIRPEEVFDAACDLMSRDSDNSTWDKRS